MQFYEADRLALIRFVIRIRPRQVGDGTSRGLGLKSSVAVRGYTVWRKLETSRRGKALLVKASVNSELRL